MATIHPDDQRYVRQEWQEALRNGHPCKAEYRYLHPDGRIIWVKTECVPETDGSGKIVGHVGTVTDISDGKTKEEELRRLVTDRIRSEESLKAEAAVLLASNRDLDNFAYVISHDLEEPLRMVTSYLLSWRISIMTSGQRGQGIHPLAQDGARRMGEMIHGVLEYSRVGGKKRILTQPISMMFFGGSEIPSSLD